MNDRLNYIPNDDKQNYHACRLKFNEPPNQNLVTLPKELKPTNNKTLGTSSLNCSPRPFRSSPISFWLGLNISWVI